MSKIILSVILATILLVYPSLGGFNTKNAIDFTNQLLPDADAATVNYYLKIEGISGESNDDKHKDWIELQSFSFGATESGTSATGGGCGAGKVKIQDLMFTSKISKASPDLFLSTANGKHFPKATLTMVNAAGGTDIIVITLSDVIISSYQVGSSGESPMESVSLNFAKIEIEYKPQSGGSVKAGWDVKANKAVDTGGSSGTESMQATSTTPKDSDNDGIPDEKDKCPTSAETRNGYQDDDGCPDKSPTAVAPSTSTITPPKDSDNDGIPDSSDKCPTTPETKNGYQDDDGCPDTPPAAIAPIKPKIVYP